MSWVEFFVLSLMVEAVRPVWHFLGKRQVIEGRFDCFHPGFTPAEVADAIGRLAARGIIDVSFIEDFAGFPGPRRYPPCDVRLTCTIGLNAKGGQIWEAIARPRWDEVFAADLVRNDTYVYTATNVECLERVPAKMGPDHEGHIEWIGPMEDVGRWAPNYWKILPNGYRRVGRRTQSAMTPEFEESVLRELEKNRSWMMYGFISCDIRVDEPKWREIGTAYASLSAVANTLSK